MAFVETPDTAGADVAKVIRKNPQCFKVLAERLDALSGMQAKAGWFESAVYENGKPVAQIAMVQEYGATINHPGGTPYKIGADGMARFVAKASAEAAGLPVTGPHTITIPPRPFMRPTVEREKAAWIALLAKGAKSILAGKTSPRDVLDAVAARAAGDIARTIASIQSPALAASTIAKRRRKMADKKTIGNLTKPLVDSGIMIDSVTHVVEDAT